MKIEKWGGSENSVQSLQRVSNSLDRLYPYIQRGSRLLFDQKGLCSVYFIVVVVLSTIVVRSHFRMLQNRTIAGNTLNATTLIETTQSWLC